MVDERTKQEPPKPDPKIIEVRNIHQDRNPDFQRWDIITDRFNFCITGTEALKLRDWLNQVLPKKELPETNE